MKVRLVSCFLALLGKIKLFHQCTGFGVFKQNQNLNVEGILNVITINCRLGEQVSKSAPTGEYLPTGSFMIRGKKNFLPPSQLVLGFGFLFRLSEESIPRHVNERGRRFHTSSIGDGSMRSSLSEPDVGPEVGALEETESSSDTDSKDEEAFPDTKVEIPVDSGTNSNRTRTISTASSTGPLQSGFETGGSTLDEIEGSVITCGVVPGHSVDISKVRKNAKKKEKEAKKKGKQGRTMKTVVEPLPPQAPPSTALKPKRGQHGRQKKLKEKYKFQDEEERELRMQLLQVWH